VALSIIFFITGLREKGTSITNPFPYQKKSLRLANQTSIQSVQNINLIIQTLLAVASAENNQTHISKYVANTAKLNNNQARIAFLRF
jgi:hypothetical protein